MVSCPGSGVHPPGFGRALFVFLIQCPTCMVFPAFGIPASSSPQHSATPSPPQCFLEPLTQSWPFGCSPQTVWACTTAQTTAPQLSPQPTHLHAHLLGGMTTLPHSSPALWAESGMKGTRSQQSQAFLAPGSSSACSSTPNPSVHSVPFVLPIPCYPVISPSSSAPGDLFLMAFPTQTPNTNAHVPISLSSPASQRVVPACPVTSQQLSPPSSGLQFHLLQ